MITDIFTYNGEADLLELRLNILGDIVDQFIICEAATTFSGDPKPLTFDRERFIKWKDKIKYFVIPETYTLDEFVEAANSKYTGGARRWIREYLQKESISKALIHLDDEDIVYIGDVDEVWEHREPKGVEKLKLRVYTYYLNMRSNEVFSGTIRARYKDIKGKCLNEIRNDQSLNTTDYQGWHFTNQGGLESVKKKIVDQYNPELFNTNLVELLPEVFGVKDFIGRNFELKVDETDWPTYLVKNRQNYLNLLK